MMEVNVCLGERRVLRQELSVLSTQFCCESKTAL